MKRRLFIALCASLLTVVAFATTHVNDAGTWRTLAGVYVNDAGTWRTIIGIWVNDAGTWRQVYAPVGCHDTTISFADISPADAFAGFRVGGISGVSAGAIQSVTGNSLAGASLFNDQTWVTPAANAANYDIMVTQLTGTVSVDTGTGPASLSTWINMNQATTGTFYVFRTNNTPSINTATARLDIRPAGGGATLSSCTITMNAEVD